MSLPPHAYVSSSIKTVVEFERVSGEIQQILTLSALVPFLTKTKSSKAKTVFSNYYDVKQV